jgi:hypothetical protein
MADTNSQQLERIRLEREELELEDLRERVGKQRLQREERRQDRIRIQLDMESNEADLRRRQSVCQHKKGGKDQKGLVYGNDSNYSVIVNTYPTGKREVLCQRCEKLWEEPPALLRKTDPKAYREQMREFEIAVNFPTDNTPSGRQLFRIERFAA